MNAIDVIALPPKASSDELWRGGADRYDYGRLPDEIRQRAMLAQGTVVEGLSSAVRRVLEAGQALSWARTELPHGEYLPWVQQACGLKPSYAAKLIKATEWIPNVEHAPHLVNGVTDATTLFMLSADTTTEDVREWFMERCTAGEPPTRAEVADRKRQSTGPRQPSSTEAQALSILKKDGELERLQAAMALAERAMIVTDEDVMAEQRLREVGKLRHIPGEEADFYLRKDGRWIRLPHDGRADVVAVAVEPDLFSHAPTDNGDGWETIRISEAADRTGIASIAQQIVPGRYKSRNGRNYFGKGWEVRRIEKRGYCQIRRVA